MKKIFLLLALFTPLYAFAADAPAVADPITSFIGDVGALISGFGGMSWALKISSIIMLIIGTSKIDFVEKMFWSKLGKAQALVGPVLGLIAGFVAVNPLNAAALAAYAFAGLGANYLYELLDLAKIPEASNATVMMVINLVQSFIKKPPQA